MNIPKFKKPEGISKIEFFGKLFQIRDAAHFAHLRSKKFSEHIALGDFYDKLLELTDTLIESYQGKYGLVDIKESEEECSCSVIETLKELGRMVDNGFIYNSFGEPWIKAQLDEIALLTYQTIYKLENL